jgi:hypothetical protein
LLKIREPHDLTIKRALAIGLLPQRNPDMIEAAQVRFAAGWENPA